MALTVLWRLEVGKVIPPLDNFVGKQIVLKGFISDIPDKRLDKTLIIIKTEDPKTKILISTNVYPEYHYGDLIELVGTLTKPQNFETDLGKVFDYENYLAKRGIYYKISNPEINLISSGHGFFLKRYLFSLREVFEKKIERALPAEQAALIGGILLGDQNGLPEKTKNDFIRTGLIHIIALSGYNITIVAEMIMRMVAFLSLRKRIFLGGLAIFLFVIMTGAQATAVRAGIMAVIALLARTLGRPFEALRALMLAGFIMFLVNPLVIYDPSFILSILATFGLIYFTPKIKFWFSFIPKKALGVEWQELVAATTATQIFVFPYILYKIGLISILAPVTNILVLPVIPILMLLGFLTGAFGIAWQVLAFPFALPTFLVASYTLFIAKIFSLLPFAVVTTSNFPFWLLVLIYGVIFAISEWQWIKKWLS